jgi:hypothetical protein
MISSSFFHLSITTLKIIDYLIGTKFDFSFESLKRRRRRKRDFQFCGKKSLGTKSGFMIHSTWIHNGF